MLVPLLAIFLCALLVSLALTPLAIRLAWATNYIDRPGGAYKAHSTATALLGGLSILLASLLTWFLVEAVRVTPARGEALALMGGALVAVLLGLWDDRHSMTPIPKMTWQALAVAVPMAAGIVPDLHLGAAGNVLVTVVLLIGLMNAVNFLDIMNGMVAGMAAIALAAFAWNSAAHGAIGVAAAQIALAGACVGFLRYNFPSARISSGTRAACFWGIVSAFPRSSLSAPDRPGGGSSVRCSCSPIRRSTWCSSSSCACAKVARSTWATVARATFDLRVSFNVRREPSFSCGSVGPSSPQAASWS